MLELRFPWLWMGIGWLLVAGVCIGSLLPAGDVQIVLNDKLLHFVSYFVLTIWFSGLYGRIGYYAFIAVVVIALGAALDLMQTTTATRTFDLFDVFANAGGALVGFVLSLAILGGWCSRVERWITR